MTGKQGIRRGIGTLAFLMALALATPAALAQPAASFNEREVKRTSNTQDKDGIWVLDFTFKDPRLITVDIPGRGRKVVWYIWYQVVNRTGEPRVFIPDFELVTLDKPAVFHDEVLPKVQKAILDIEDPTHALMDVKNSVTISSEPIPVSRADATPRKVTGVAIWDDTTKDKVLQDSTRFSIFVAGLSNGWSMDDKETIRRKTLQLNFRRLGDKYYQDSREIRFTPPAEWLYRASTLSAPGTPAKPKETDTPMPREGVTPAPKPAETPKKEEVPPAPKAGETPKKEGEGPKPAAPLELGPKLGQVNIELLRPLPNAPH